MAGFLKKPAHMPHAVRGYFSRAALLQTSVQDIDMRRLIEVSAFAFAKMDTGKDHSPQKGWARRTGFVRTRTGVTGRRVHFLVLCPDSEGGKKMTLHFYALLNDLKGQRRCFHMKINKQHPL